MSIIVPCSWYYAGMIIKKKLCGSMFTIIPPSKNSLVHATVDGRNPAPPWMVETL